MKKTSLLLAVILLTITSAFSQESYTNRYVLYPTTNVWMFLKLDTSTGKLWQVQFSTNGHKYRFESILSDTDLVEDNNRHVGRFKLYPTDNFYNFIMLDTQLGTTYQVQWSHESEKRMVLPIPDESIFPGYTKVERNGKCNMLDLLGNLLFAEWFDDYSYVGNDYFLIKENGKYNFIRLDGKLMLGRWYSYCEIIENDIAVVFENTKWNFVSFNTGQEISDEWFDDYESFNKEGIAKIKIGDTWYSINKKGKRKTLFTNDAAAL